TRPRQARHINFVRGQRSVGVRVDLVGAERIIRRGWETKVLLSRSQSRPIIRRVTKLHDLVGIKKCLSWAEARSRIESVATAKARIIPNVGVKVGEETSKIYFPGTYALVARKAFHAHVRAVSFGIIVDEIKVQTFAGGEGEESIASDKPIGLR